MEQYLKLALFSFLGGFTVLVTIGRIISSILFEGKASSLLMIGISWFLLYIVTGLWEFSQIPFEVLFKNHCAFFGPMFLMMFLVYFFERNKNNPKALEED